MKLKTETCNPQSLITSQQRCSLRHIDFQPLLLYLWIYIAINQAAVTPYKVKETER